MSVNSFGASVRVETPRNSDFAEILYVSGNRVSVERTVAMFRQAGYLAHCPEPKDPPACYTSARLYLPKTTQ